MYTFASNIYSDDASSITIALMFKKAPKYYKYKASGKTTTLFIT